MLTPSTLSPVVPQFTVLLEWIRQAALPASSITTTPSECALRALALGVR
jgi:hypothetical protein